jgi:AcrR family transcriptional regulator
VLTVPPPSGADPEARTRIRDVALELFGERGVARTTVRAVAERAGVSAALVIHHYGSKDGLRETCDEHVVTTVRDRKRAALAGPDSDPVDALRSWPGGQVLLRYLARTLVDGTPAVAALVDHLVDDAVGYTEEGVRAGRLRAPRHPREQAAVLTLWALGALVLREHGQRLLGVDLAGDPAAQGPYALVAAELLTHGVLEPGYLDQLDPGLAGDPS